MLGVALVPAEPELDLLFMELIHCAEIKKEECYGISLKPSSGFELGNE